MAPISEAGEEENQAAAEGKTQTQEENPAAEAAEQSSRAPEDVHA